MEHYFLFDFDEVVYLVKYQSTKDLADEIEEAILNYDYEDAEYSDIVEDVMTVMGVKYEIVPCRRYTF